MTAPRLAWGLFALVMDTRNDPKWMTNVIEVGRGSDQPVAPGLEIEETVKFDGVRLKVVLTITEHLKDLLEAAGAP